jgi:hypothetical protein
MGATPQLTRFAELEKRRRELEVELKIIEKEEEELEPAVLEQFIESGVSKVTLNGLTVYLHKSLFAGTERRDNETTDEAYERACQRLAEIGFQDLVQTRFNTQSLAAVLREMAPAELEAFKKDAEGVIAVGEKTSLRSRKAA